MITQLAVPKKAGQHSQGLVCEHLIDERFLSFEGFDGATGGQFVATIENGRYEFGPQFCGGKQTAACFAVAVVLGLAENELSAIGVITDIKPVHALFEKRRSDNLLPGRPRVHARNNDVRLALRVLRYILSRCLPFQAPKQVQAIDQHRRFVESDF